MSSEVDVIKKLLHIQGISLHPDTRLITLDIYEGEIVGLAGLEGHGQQEFLKALCGLYMPYEGYIVANLDDGNTITITNNHDAAKAGVLYLPRQRDTEGIFPPLTVFDNYAISNAIGFCFHPKLNLKRRFILMQFNQFFKSSVHFRQ